MTMNLQGFSSLRASLHVVGAALVDESDEVAGELLELVLLALLKDSAFNLPRPSSF